LFIWEAGGPNHPVCQEVARQTPSANIYIQLQKFLGYLETILKGQVQKLALTKTIVCHPKKYFHGIAKKPGK
jgi:hypothetical protein